eukprot:5024548-Prymnesium_polylepis.4
MVLPWEAELDHSMRLVHFQPQLVRVQHVVLPALGGLVVRLHEQCDWQFKLRTAHEADADALGTLRDVHVALAKLWLAIEQKQLASHRRAVQRLPSKQPE